MSTDSVSAFIEQEFADAPKKLTSNVYHYTSSDAAILGILANRTIRMSPFQGTNDLWESRPLWPNLEGELESEQLSKGDGFEVWEEIDRYIRGYSKVACFTQDWDLPGRVMQPDALRGWSHLSLWAHYGASHTGVCLRFDRERLVRAFEAAGSDAVHQFHGPVRYLSAEIGMGPHGINLEQAEEFGIDAVALRYAHVHHDRVFFRKHSDWANEFEFRLVRTDLSIEPHYFDITQALTGVVLGDAFPADRIPALRTMLTGFGDVEVMQVVFHNRTLDIFALETSGVPEAASRMMPDSISTIPPRREGDLSERLRSLEEVEQTAEEERETAMQAVAPVLQMWREELASRPDVYADWPDVALSLHSSSTAIPPGDQRKRPGVPGEVIAHQAGLMVVGEHQPQHSFTWVMAIAVQVMPNRLARLHACITTEEWRDQGNQRRELYRDRRDVNVCDILEKSKEIFNDLLESVPDARSEFDEIRNE